MDPLPVPTPQAAVETLVERPFFLAGEWRTSALQTVICAPYDGRPLARVCMASERDIDEAAARATKAFDATRRLTSFDRATILRRLHDGVIARRSEIERTMVDEAGKPVQLVRQEVERGLSTLALAAEEAKRIGGEVIPLDLVPQYAHKIGITRRIPIGPVLGIPAFNFPFNLVCHKIAPALAAGNPVLLKPAPQTPLTSLLVAEIFESTGAPRGMLSVLPCSNEVAERLVTDDRIKALTFTGSSKVGWHLKNRAGKKRTLLELGGNAGVLIDADADLDLAAQRSALAAFAYAGQICVSLQRIYAHRDVFSTFTDKLVAMTSRLQVGDPADERTLISPMISDAAADRAEALVSQAVAAGATVLAGGTRRGRAVAPTILADVTPDMRICQEEAFGPVVTLAPFTDINEGIAMVNATPYGLSAGIFTGRLAHAMKAFDGIEAGTIVINDAPLFRADNGPFGGCKDSGLGREAVRHTLEHMTDLKLMVVSA